MLSSYVRRHWGAIRWTSFSITNNNNKFAAQDSPGKVKPDKGVNLDETRTKVRLLCTEEVRAAPAEAPRAAGLDDLEPDLSVVHKGFTKLHCLQQGTSKNRGEYATYCARNNDPLHRVARR